MRRTHPNPVHLPRRQRRTPSWLEALGWTVLFVALSAVVLAATAYSV